MNTPSQTPAFPSFISDSDLATILVMTISWVQSHAREIPGFKKLGSYFRSFSLEVEQWLGSLDPLFQAEQVAEVNASIAANADQEELVDQPEVVKGVTRVSGPFTMEAVQPPEMSLGEARTITDEGEFGGAPEELESFPPFTMQMLESRLDQEEQNLEAYLDQMIRYLKMDGVRFPNNKQMHFHWLEPVLDGSMIHAEGRWANGEKDPDPEGRANVGIVRSAVRSCHNVDFRRKKAEEYGIGFELPSVVPIVPKIAAKTKAAKAA